MLPDNRWIKAFIDLVFPPKCYSCGQNSKQLICHLCLRKINPNIVFGVAKNTSQVFDFVVTLYNYDDVIKEIFHQIKFNGKKELLDLVTKLVLVAIRNIERTMVDFVPDYFISVPLSRKRIKKRGFNQVDLAIVALSEKYNVEYSGTLLERIIETKPQFELSRKERLKNVEGAFKVKESMVNKNILIFDDILTTGATLYECAKALKLAGANRVAAIAFSRAHLNS